MPFQLPAYCPTCDRYFPTFLTVSGAGSFGSFNNRYICNVCRSPARVMDGEFQAINDKVARLNGNQLISWDLEALKQVLEEIYAGKIKTTQEAEKKIEAKAAGFLQYFNLKNAKTLGAIIAAIALTLEAAVNFKELVQEDPKQAPEIRNIEQNNKLEINFNFGKQETNKNNEEDPKNSSRG